VKQSAMHYTVQSKHFRYCWWK